MIRSDFDSDEEFHFYHWLIEAEKFGMIDSWEYHTEPFGLSGPVSIIMEKKMKTKTKTIQKHLMRDHKYTPDFKIKIVYQEFRGVVKKAFQFPPPDWKDGIAFLRIDVKGEWCGRHKSGREFSINQKWMFQRYGIYIHKIVPKIFFKKTWVPDEIAWIRKRNVPTRRKAYRDCRLFGELKS